MREYTDPKGRTFQGFDQNPELASFTIESRRKTFYTDFDTVVAGILGVSECVNSKTILVRHIPTGISFPMELIPKAVHFTCPLFKVKDTVSLIKLQSVIIRIIDKYEALPPIERFILKAERRKGHN